MSVTVGHPGRRRAAAWVALVCGALATAMLLTTILTNPLASILSAAAFVFLVASGWVALTNRGQKRLIAVLIVVAAVVVLVATVVRDDEHRYFLLAAIVAAGITVPAGRYALGRPPRRGAGDEPVPAAARPALVVNPRSGDGRAAQLGLIPKAREQGIRVYEFDGTTAVLDLVQQALDDGADVVGVAGGDGSLAAAAALAAERGADFVCVPAGTRNHFALDVGLDRADPLAALGAFGVAHRRRVDLARVNGVPFLNNVSVGLYGSIVQDSAYRGDKWGTTLALLPDLVTADPQALDLSYTDDDGDRRDDAQVILVSNNPYTMAGVGLASRARLDTGSLGVVCLRIDGGRAAEVFARAVFGVGNTTALRSWSVTTFQVDSSGPVPIGLDGEAVTLDPPLRFESVPAAVWVRLPDSAPGESPAAANPGYRETVRELVRRAALPVARWHDPAPR